MWPKWLPSHGKEKGPTLPEWAQDQPPPDNRPDRSSRTTMRLLWAIAALSTLGLIFTHVSPSSSLMRPMRGHELVPRKEIPPGERKRVTGGSSRSYYLRIQPLGASLTWGTGSESGNGYRKPLRDQLRFDGWNVNMIGSQRSGSMKDNRNEGWPGDRIDEIDFRADNSLSQMPNVVLINAGTNDCIQDFAIPDASARLGRLLDKILFKVPDVTIIMSTLLPNSLREDCIVRVNSQYRELVLQRQGLGQKIVLAEMHDGFITHSDLIDSIHPADAGYRKMAAVWHKAILTAESRKFLKAPIKTEVPDEGWKPCPAASTELQKDRPATPKKKVTPEQSDPKKKVTPRQTEPKPAEVKKNEPKKAPPKPAEVKKNEPEKTTPKKDQLRKTAPPTATCPPNAFDDGPVVDPGLPKYRGG